MDGSGKGLYERVSQTMQVEKGKSDCDEIMGQCTHDVIDFGWKEKTIKLRDQLIAGGTYTLTGASHTHPFPVLQPAQPFKINLFLKQQSTDFI
jgi:hypothetical protein